MTDRLRESIVELARQDPRFPVDAYLLVFEGLEVALGKLATRRHVSPTELIAGVRRCAVERWGLLAGPVLDSWNLRSGQDLGEVVFNLVERGLLVASDEDTRTEFASAPPLCDGLDDAFLEELERHPPRLVASK